MVPSGTKKIILGEGAFSSVPAQRSLGPVSEMHGVFSNSDLPSALRGTQM